MDTHVASPSYQPQPNPMQQNFADDAGFEETVAEIPCSTSEMLKCEDDRSTTSESVLQTQSKSKKSLLKLVTTNPISTRLIEGFSKSFKRHQPKNAASSDDAAKRESMEQRARFKEMAQMRSLSLTEANGIASTSTNSLTSHANAVITAHNLRNDMVVPLQQLGAQVREQRVDIMAMLANGPKSMAELSSRASSSSSSAGSYASSASGSQEIFQPKTSVPKRYQMVADEIMDYEQNRCSDDDDEGMGEDPPTIGEAWAAMDAVTADKHIGCVAESAAFRRREKRQQQRDETTMEANIEHAQEGPSNSKSIWISNGSQAGVAGAPASRVASSSLAPFGNN